MPASWPGWTGTRSPPPCTRSPASTPDGTEHYEPISGWKTISRSDTGAVLSISKDTYTVIDHGEMGEIVEAVLAQPNVKWETAGVLEGGKAVWCLALLDEPITLPGDASPTLPYLAITNRHDGTAACALRATAVRIVCANTFRAAELEGERTGTTFSFIHKASWRNRIDEARQAVTGAKAEMRRYQELAADLLAIPITTKQRELFVTAFIPMPPTGLVTDRVARNVDEPAWRCGRSSAPPPLSWSPGPPTGWYRRPVNTSITSAPPGPGRPGSTGP